MLRGLLVFRAVYEDSGQDTLYHPEVGEWSLWDVEYLFQESQGGMLFPRQAQAIELCWVQNMKESDAAERMGILPSNPVGMYANEGARTMIEVIEAGRMDRFRLDVTAA